MFERQKIWYLILIILVLGACSPQTEQKASEKEAAEFYRPEVDLGVLFHDVQMAHI